MFRHTLAPLAILGAAASLTLAGCGGGGSSNPSPAVTQRVTGFVWNADTAAPIVDAIVRVQGTNVQAQTVADGSYTLGPLNPSRAYDLVITKTGFVDSAVKILSKSNTLQAPQVILTPANPAVSITNATGGNVDSNATLEGNTAEVDVPANALPGGVTNASVGATLLVGPAVPGADSNNSRIVYPAVSLALSGATGDFTLPVKLTFPLPFTMTVGALVPVVKLGTNGQWAPVVPAANATVEAGGETASFNTTKIGTFGLSIPINATVNGTPTTTRQNLPGPYTDPVVYDLTGATINWSTSDPDGRDALDSAFIQSQRQGDINVAGDLDATKLVIRPRGTSQIVIVKTTLNVNVQATGVTIQQAPSATGTVDDLASYEIVPHTQGGGSGT